MHIAMYMMSIISILMNYGMTANDMTIFMNILYWNIAIDMCRIYTTDILTLEKPDLEKDEDARHHSNSKIKQNKLYLGTGTDCFSSIGLELGY